MNIVRKLRAGIIGATGMVGQRFLTLLENHPFFEVTALAASGHSAGQRYTDAVQGRWKLATPIPAYAKDMVIYNAEEDIDTLRSLVDFVFCAVNMKKEDIQKLEERYAKAEIPVVSNNSAHRATPDVPMVIPEINADHFSIITQQRNRLGTKYGFIAVKPNCSIQSYVPALTPLLQYVPTEVVVTTYQAISGAGKTFHEWPQMQDNVIPYIGGEEEKSEQEPLKIWGHIQDNTIIQTEMPLITSQCIRVPVTDGHLACVFVRFRHKPVREQILRAWAEYKGMPQIYALPSAPKQFLTYFEEPDRPQTRLDRDLEGGMGIALGRLREDTLFDYKFVGISHNTIRGAAGGAVLEAEALTALGYLKSTAE